MGKREVAHYLIKKEYGLEFLVDILKNRITEVEVDKYFKHEIFYDIHHDLLNGNIKLSEPLELYLEEIKMHWVNKHFLIKDVNDHLSDWRILDY